jgi:acyl-coenzyme A thioesterase PaaI-like protein
MFCPELGLQPPNQPNAVAVYEAAVAHFSAMPWCARLLQNTITFLPQCRSPASDEHDQFLGRTLASDRAVPHMLCFFQRPPQKDEDGDVDWRSAESPPVGRVSTLYALGHGMSGFPAVAHGGGLMALADEAMGMLLELNLALGKAGDGFGSNSVTAALETRFRRPVPTGGALLVTAWTERRQGRRMTVRCEFTDEAGEVLVSCSSEWVAVKERNKAKV